MPLWRMARAPACCQCAVLRLIESRLTPARIPCCTAIAPPGAQEQRRLCVGVQELRRRRAVRHRRAGGRRCCLTLLHSARTFLAAVRRPMRLRKKRAAVAVCVLNFLCLCACAALG